MALTRKFLTAMGIEAEKVDQIIEAHTEVTDALKTERDQYKEGAEKLEAVQKELDDLKAAAEKDGRDPYKVKYEALKEEFDAYKKDIADKETSAKKEAALRAVLKEIGVAEKRIDAVVKVTDIEAIQLDGEGKIKDGDKLKESLKTEWSDFITTTKTEGANTATPPANNQGKTTMTKAEIRAIADPAARQKAMLENPSLFGLPETNS